MRHSRYGLHPLVTFVWLAVVGSTIGVGLHIWVDPWTSAIVVAGGAVGGLVVSHVAGDGLLYGFAVGGLLSLAALGVRAFISVVTTLDRPPSVTSPRVWFSR